MAMALRGQATFRLQDYAAFCSIALLELIFVKAKLAASDPIPLITLMERLIGGENESPRYSVPNLCWMCILLTCDVLEICYGSLERVLPKVKQGIIIAFTTG